MTIKNLGFYSPKSRDQLLIQGDTMKALIEKSDGNTHRLFVVVPSFEISPTVLRDNVSLNRDNSFAPDGYLDVLHKSIADILNVDDKDLAETQRSGLVPDDKSLALLLSIADSDRRIPHAVYAFILKPGNITVSTNKESFSFKYSYELNEKQLEAREEFDTCVTSHFDDMYNIFGNYEEAVDVMKDIINRLKERK